MASFSIKGSSGFIKINIEELYGFPDETSPFGGYGTKSRIKLESNSYSVNSIVWLSTGSLYNLYKELEPAQRQLKGTASFTSDENDLWFVVEYDELGCVSINGEYKQNYQERNILKFEIFSDQSYIERSLTKLKRIVEKYGDNAGKRLK